MSEDQSEKIYNKLKVYCQQHGIELSDGNFDEVMQKALTKEEYDLCFLPETIAGQVDQLAMRGDVLAEQGNLPEAIKIYEKGLAIIPKPKPEYEATLWFLVAIGDAYWYLQNWKKALTYFDRSLKAAGGEDNPFVHLRRGQLFYELREMDTAKQELILGLDAAGKELFEEEDPKYLALAVGQ